MTTAPDVSPANASAFEWDGDDGTDAVPAVASPPPNADEPVSHAESTSVDSNDRDDSDGEAPTFADPSALELPSVLASELGALRSELDERLDDLQRVTAEYANYRKRVDRDREAVVG